jgi:hypothetical protein
MVTTSLKIRNALHLSSKNIRTQEGKIRNARGTGSQEV